MTRGALRLYAGDPERCAESLLALQRFTFVQIALLASLAARSQEEGGVVRKYTLAGVELAHWGSYGTGPGQFNQPFGIAVDAAGNVYVSDTENNRVQVFTNDGAFLQQWGGYGYAPGQFYRPTAVAVGPDGRIYVSDAWNNRIQVFGSLATPTTSTTWGRIKALYR